MRRFLKRVWKGLVGFVDWLRVRRIKALRWLGNNYIWLFILVGSVGVVWAYRTYVFQLPFLISDTLSELTSILKGQPDTPDESKAEITRNLAYAFAALAGALTIMATIPFQLIRVWLNERTARTNEQSHITDQINKAVEGLGAEKTVKDENGERTVPNIEVRIGAIYALERISQDSLRDHVQIMEILTAYLRQNSPASTAQDFPEPDWEPLAENADEEAKAAHNAARLERFGSVPAFDMTKAWKWGKTLGARTDIQAAMQVLGRRTNDQCAMEVSDIRYGPNGYRMDLRKTNLQAVDISRGNFQNAQLQNARMEGANLANTDLALADLSSARLEGANLVQARLQYATLSKAQMEGVNLFDAKLEAAQLRHTKMEGANLAWAQMRDAHLPWASLERAVLYNAQTHGTSLLWANLEAANLREAKMYNADFSWARLEGAKLSEAHLHGTKLSQTQVNGAELYGAWMEGKNLLISASDPSKDLRSAQVFGSALRSIDFTNIQLAETFLTSTFGDGSVILPEGYSAGEGVLSHWHPKVLNTKDFEKAWHAWQEEAGYFKGI